MQHVTGKWWLLVAVFSNVTQLLQWEQTIAVGARVGSPEWLPGRSFLSPERKRPPEGGRISLLLLLYFGRGEKIRTSDPLHPMQVRYQAALRPDEPRIIAARSGKRNANVMPI
jgi:hypothetical protein